MPILFKFLALCAYWIFLTRSLLMTCPWELISENLALHPPIDLSFEPTSWLAHISAYGLLGLLIQEATAHQPKLKRSLLILALIHSGACEYLQGFIPGRWPNGWDMFSNMIGLFMSLSLHKILATQSQIFLSRIFPKKPVA